MRTINIGSVQKKANDICDCMRLYVNPCLIYVIICGYMRFYVFAAS